jgi:hypothetical protein
VVSAEARRLAGIVEDIFLLARADTGQQPLRPRDLYLDELVGECVRSVRSLPVARGVAITVAMEGEFPFRGDEALLHRLLLKRAQVLAYGGWSASAALAAAGWICLARAGFRAAGGFRDGGADP